MRRICASDLEKREVINLCTGQKIGYICDYELDVDCGQILAIIVSSDSGIPFLSKKDEYAIPWCKIECIGEDTILIKLSASDISGYARSCKKNKCKL